MKPEAAKFRDWRNDPLLFVRECFGAEPDAWQADVLSQIGGDGRKRLAMKACAGPGKTTVESWAGWHRLTCYGDKGDHPKGSAVSITRENLEMNLWPEMAKWQQRSPLLKKLFTWTKSRIFANDHPETWFLAARGFTKDANPEEIGRTLSGQHSGYNFYLIDESGDIPPQIAKSAEQGLSECIAGLIITAGNTTSQQGMLYEACMSGKYIVVSITADPDDAKRTPRVSAEWAKEQIALYGRDNPWVMAYILGQFPPGSMNSLLSIEDVEAAMSRHLKADQYDFAARILGVDVARQGDDRTVIFARQGLMGHLPKIIRNEGSQEIAGRVGQNEDHWQSDATFVDGTGGYGAGVVDAMRVVGRSPIEVQFAGSPLDSRYANKRAEMHFLMAKWIKEGGALPRIPEMIAELVSPTYSIVKDKFLVEPKESVKKRIGRSPDLADALALTFAFPVAPTNRHIHPYLGIGESKRAGRCLTEFDPFDPTFA